MAGAQDLLARLPALLGTAVRVIPAPCVGRCEQAPVAVVHHNAVPMATSEAVQRRGARPGHGTTRLKPYIDRAAYAGAGRLRVAARLR